MKSRFCTLCLSLSTLLVPSASVFSAPPHLIERPTPTATVVGYQDTPLLPWTANKYHVHDPYRPLPRIVVPQSTPLPVAPPSDAVDLFAGASLDKWQPSSWKIIDGSVQAVGHESLRTKKAFGDCQLHIQWMVPKTPDANFMNRGNSGVLMMGRYEIQIFDSWSGHKRQIYPDGQAAAIYGQTPPLVNACRAPGQWQTYDIVFRAPMFRDGKLIRRARLTMFHNGVLVHWNQEIMGPMAHRQILPYQVHAAQLPLELQGHGCPVRFRNIWIRPL